MTETDQGQQMTTEEETSHMSGWKIPVSLLVMAALVLLVGTALFGDFGQASAAMIRAEEAVTNAAKEDEEDAAQEVTRSAVYEDDAPAGDRVRDVIPYDPQAYIEAARQINVFDGELEEAYLAEREAQAAAQAAWYQAPYHEEETAYSAPSQDACIGDGLTY